MSVLVIAYLCILFPLLFGAMGKHYMRQSQLPAYVLGHALQFACLCVCGWVIKLTGVSIISFASVYVVLTGVVGIFCVIVSFRDWKEFFRWKPTFLGIGVLILEMGLMAFSVRFTLPHVLDMTGESLYRLKVTGTLDNMGVLLYGIVLAITDMNPVTLVQLYLPICFLPLFYSAYHWFAKGRMAFLVFAYAVFAIMVFFPGYLGMEVFLNSWNPLTMSLTVWLPILLALLERKAWVESGIVLLAILGLEPEVLVYVILFVVIGLVLELLARKRGGSKQ